jgi:hypothetical protein
MKSGARMLGMAILGLVVLTAVSVAGLSAWVYSGPEREKQASAIARELFHFIYQSSQGVSSSSPSPTASGDTIK